MPVHTDTAPVGVMVLLPNPVLLFGPLSREATFNDTHPCKATPSELDLSELNFTPVTTSKVLHLLASVDFSLKFAGLHLTTRRSRVLTRNHQRSNIQERNLVAERWQLGIGGDVFGMIMVMAESRSTACKALQSLERLQALLSARVADAELCVEQGNADAIESLTQLLLRPANALMTDICNNGADIEKALLCGVTSDSAWVSQPVSPSRDESGDLAVSQG